MSSTDKSLYRYDEYVPILLGDDAVTAEQWPAARLFLHLLEDNQTKNGNVKFTKSYLPEADAYYHTDGHANKSNAPNTVSPDFVNAFRSIADKMAGSALDSGKISALKAKVQGKSYPVYLTSALNLAYPGYQALAAGATIVGRNDQSNVNAFDLNNIYGPTWSLKTGGAATATQFNADIAGTGNYNGDSQPLPYKLDRYYLKQTLDAHFKATSASASGKPSSFFDDIAKSAADEKVFYRKPGQTDKLFMKEGDKEVEVQAGSQKFLELTINNYCYTTGLHQSGNCNEFITKCLNGTDIQECKAFMDDASFNDSSKMDIKNMNPDMAVTMLKSFRVPIKAVHVDEAGMSLDMFATTGEWIEYLKNNHQGTGANKLSEAEINKIAQQSALIAHLDRVITKVNANPAILNKNYTSGSLETNPNAFNGTTFSKYGLQPKQYNVNSSAPNMSSVLALRNTVIANRNYAAGVYGVPVIGFMQRGGAELQQAMEEQAGGAPVQINAAEILERQFDAFLANLKAHNKALDSGDANHVKSLIGELRTLEQKLNKASVYTDKYMKLIGVFGQQHDATVFDLKNLEKFVDKRNNYFERVNKKQDSLFDILSALANANQKETTEKVGNVTANPEWARI